MQECAWEGCANPSKASYTSSKSTYCRECAPKAAKIFKDRMNAGRDERDTKYKAFAKAWAEATQKGAEAFENAKPIPMVVQQHERVFDDSSRVTQEWVVNDGVCGFAWLVARPGNASFSHWAKKNLGARSAYGGGLHITLPVGRTSQSLTRKEAAARAMQDSLREALLELDPKVSVYAHSRID
jgi:hypothetical protein